jgi:ABC-type transport system substrate-binding protein
MRTDQPPFTDVRVRRAISQALDRQAMLEAVYLRGEPTPAVPRGLPAWSLRIDELGAGAKYYQYNPQEARRLLADAGFPHGFHTQLSTSGGLGPDLLDAVQLTQRYLKDVSIEAQLHLQEWGVYMATTFQGKFEGLAMSPFATIVVPHSSLYGMYMPDHPLNKAHVHDAQITAMLKEQMRGRVPPACG